MYNLLANETAASLRVFSEYAAVSGRGLMGAARCQCLTFQQQWLVEESRIESLAGLDLASLICSLHLPTSLK